MKTAKGCFSKWPEVFLSTASPQEQKQGSCGCQCPAGYLVIRQLIDMHRRKSMAINMETRAEEGMGFGFNLKFS